MPDGRAPISLREYVDVRFDAQEKAVQSALAAAEKAVIKAETASEKRFESVNEFRSTLNDYSRTLMPRSEAEQALKTINDKIDILTSRINKRDDRGRGMGEIWGYIAGAVGMLVAIVAIFRGHV